MEAVQQSMTSEATSIRLHRVSIQEWCVPVPRLGHDRKGLFVSASIPMFCMPFWKPCAKFYPTLPCPVSSVRGRYSEVRGCFCSAPNASIEQHW